MAPKGIYFNFLGFCIGAFTMAKKGDKVRIVDENENIAPRRKKRRVKTYPSAENEAAITDIQLASTNADQEASLKSLSSTQHSDMRAGEDTILSSSRSFVISDPSADESEYETDDDECRLSSRSSGSGKSDNISEEEVLNFAAICTFLSGALLVMSPLLAFIIFGIIFLIQSQAECSQEENWLWIYCLVFMLLFFPTACIATSYKWAFPVWTTLFVVQSIILWVPGLTCENIKYNSLYVWAMWAYYFLLAHLIISLIVFIATDLRLSPNSPRSTVHEEEGTNVESCIPRESTPLVGKSMV